MTTRCCLYPLTWGYRPSAQDWVLLKDSLPDQLTPNWNRHHSERNHPFYSEVAGDNSVATSNSDEEDTHFPSSRETTWGNWSPSTICVNHSLTWSFPSGEQKSDQGYSDHGNKPQHQGTVLPIGKRPWFLHLKIWHVTIIIFHIFGPCILTVWGPSVSKVRQMAVTQGYEQR